MPRVKDDAKEDPTMGTEKSQSTHRNRNISRRDALRLGGVLAAGAAVAPYLSPGQAQAQTP
jgi:hypothetical protein